jgi:hypothetical protein
LFTFNGTYELILYDLYPVLLLLAALGVAILWEVRHAVARVAARRLTTAAMGFFFVLMIVSLPIRLLAPAPLLPGSHLLSWQVSHLGGSGFDSATAETTTVVPIEVEHPSCAPIDVGPWLAEPIITYTPWSVTITMHLNDTADTAKCSTQAGSDGRLPIVGNYLMGVIYRVQLSEALGGRILFDGSAFLPAERPYS